MFIIKRNFYDYFSGNKISYEKYETSLVAYARYKELKDGDKNYGDTVIKTEIFYSLSMPVKEKRQRPHARSAEAWERMKCKSEPYDWNAFFDSIIEQEDEIMI